MSENFDRELWKVCLEAVNRLETRRDNSNKFFITVFTTIIGGIFYFLATFKDYWVGWVTLIICLLSALICFLWSQILIKFKKIISKKFEVVYKIEESFSGIKPITCEKFLFENDKSLITKYQLNSVFLCAIVIMVGILLSMFRIFQII